MSGTYNHRWSSGVNEVLPVQRCRRAVQREDHGRDRGRGPREGRGTRQEGARGRPDRLEDARRLRAEPDPRRVPGQRAVTTALSTWWYVGWASGSFARPTTSRPPWTARVSTRRRCSTSRARTSRSTGSRAACGGSGPGGPDERARDLDRRGGPGLDGAGARARDRARCRRPLQPDRPASAGDRPLHERHPRGRSQHRQEPGRRGPARAHARAGRGRARPRHPLPREGEGRRVMETVVALSTNQTAWWISLGVGLVVALVVWGLLEALRRTVAEVERAVEDVWTMGKRVAQNTSTSYLMGTTLERGGELLGELEQHRAGGGV